MAVAHACSGRLYVRVLACGAMKSRLVWSLGKWQVIKNSTNSYSVKFYSQTISMVGSLKPCGPTSTEDEAIELCKKYEAQRDG
jgi:hypothetical protein